MVEINIKYIYISEGHNYYGRYGKGSLDYTIVEQEDVELVAGSGIKGDRFFDYKEDYKGQITFFSESTIEAVKNELGFEHATGKLFRRNVVIEGMKVEDLIGKGRPALKRETFGKHTR